MYRVLLYAWTLRRQVGRLGDNKTSKSCSFVLLLHNICNWHVLTIREFSFHQFNANLLWPGTFAFCEWLSQNRSLLEGQNILELGRRKIAQCEHMAESASENMRKGKVHVEGEVTVKCSPRPSDTLICGTGALAIFIRKYLGVDITTSDFDDKEVEENIVHNCKANEVKLLPHVRHTWGEPFPVSDPNWDLIIASDILLYVKQYPNLIKTLSFLLKSYKQTNASSLAYYAGESLELCQPVFLMSWRRRIGGEEAHFFSGCEHDGLSVKHIGSRVYCISPRIDA
ncbi:hypothetical protein KSP39_PZI007046 [Platanthera zijinensis]|uniref:Uncharacterized protein n=1 Tax=Platanthera zijinensis TaxID=2320716 RepID=A0AAP0BPY6_9ASPA